MAKSHYSFLNQHIQSGFGADALEIFKLNVYLYPTSANAFDSLGEIYEELGDTQLAIKNYEQSLKLDPQNKNADQHIKKLRSGK